MVGEQAASARARLAAFAALVAFVVFASSVIVLGVAADHASLGWRTRILMYPSVPSWVGYPQIGLVVAIGFALVVPVFMTNASPWAMAAAAMLAAIFGG